jgi:hypothetical protein
MASSAASSVRPPRPKKEPQALVIPKNAAEEQKLKLERLMKNPVRRRVGSAACCRPYRFRSRASGVDGAPSPATRLRNSWYPTLRTVLGKEGLSQR